MLLAPPCVHIVLEDREESLPPHALLFGVERANQVAPISIAHSIKTADIFNEDKDGDLTDPIKEESSKKVKRGIRGRK